MCTSSCGGRWISLAVRKKKEGAGRTSRTSPVILISTLGTFGVFSPSIFFFSSSPDSTSPFCSFLTSPSPEETGTSAAAASSSSSESCQGWSTRVAVT